MKNILFMAMVTILATLNLQAENSSVENCKAFIKEAQAYKSTMKQDNISKATLAFYKDEVVGQCGNIASKMPYDKKYFANALTKKQNESVYMCKKSIEMAKTYAQTPNKSFLVTQAHKEHVISNCGTLVAKKPSAYCLFDVIDESKEDKKARCLASVKRAKAFQKTNNKDIELVQSHKDEIRANCGSLMAKS
jgi:hypothetical protein